MNILKYKSPFGILTIQENGGKISQIYLPNAEPIIESPLSFLNKPPSTAYALDTPFQKGALESAAAQFTEYFEGNRKVFDLPLSFDGCTDFMKSVYQELLIIPYGETVSYKYIAEKINCPKAYRAVGLANNKNPLPVIIPCHRVIGSDGKLVGYAGGIDMKSSLLEFERNNK